MTVTPAHKILLLPMCGFGDAVCYLPFLQSLRQHYPTARIVCLVISEPARAILEASNTRVEVIPFNRGGQQRGWQALIRIIRSLRGIQFDAVISGAHPDSPRIPIFAWLSGAKIRIGAKAERLSFLYNRRLDIDTDSHAYNRFRLLLGGLGVDLPAQLYRPVVEPPMQAREEAARMWSDAGLDNARRVVGLISGADSNARGRWKPYLKRWAPERYAEIAKWISEEAGGHTVVFGGPDEKRLGDDIAAGSGVPIVNFCGKTGVAVLPWLLQKCGALVSNDTGLMHLGAAVGTPIVALFGPTSHLSFGPQGEQHFMIQGQVACSPCYPHPTCDLTDCGAMRDVSVEMVKSALLKMF